MVRRTRGFIQDNYAETDSASGRKYLTLDDGTRSYFPDRTPRTLSFVIDESDPDDQYANLYSSEVVTAIAGLNLPRYGLANYLTSNPKPPPTPSEAKQLQGLTRAGRRLMGFCRTNLFKRLESGGLAFIQSLERHLLRNYVLLHALREGLPIPLGAQDSSLLDSSTYDEDIDDESPPSSLFLDDDDDESRLSSGPSSGGASRTREEAEFMARAEALYRQYSTQYASRFRWLRADLFKKKLARDIASDCRVLLAIVQESGEWEPARDNKLNELHRLVAERHPEEKVIVFTQFADTARYLKKQLDARGLLAVSAVTGQDEDPTSYAWRFSPVSNNKRRQVTSAQEIRVLLATDVLSEGQNLQDAAIVVNYDLPWAIIRLVQRAGRVDRIGQLADQILCYSFLPAEGVERIIRLRARVRQRLDENAEVVGTDESFFEDEAERVNLKDLYDEKAGILDGEADTEVDLSSYAYQVWKNAIARFPELENLIPSLPGATFSTRGHERTDRQPNGVLIYLKTASDSDALAWLDSDGVLVTQSQFSVLRAAECEPETEPAPRQANHHDLVARGAKLLVAEERSVGGQLGRPSGARFKTYERLKRHAEQARGTLFESTELARAIDEIYRFPLRQAAVDSLNRQLRIGISDQKLAELVLALREEDRLCLIQDDDDHAPDSRLICSLGLGPRATPDAGGSECP